MILILSRLTVISKATLDGPEEQQQDLESEAPEPAQQSDVQEESAEPVEEDSVSLSAADPLDDFADFEDVDEQGAVDVKLDLAKTYLDMGDPEGARGDTRRVD